MLSKQDTWELAQKLRYSLKIQNSMGFADTSITPPDIDFYPDLEQFFNPAENIIHIGAYGITERFEADSEEDFLEAMNFVRGHEEEHCRSTAQRPYAIGIQKGCEEILRYISSKEDKVTRRFRTPQDFEHYANVVLPKMGIYINWGRVQQIVGGIANSLEDGRIERIRAARFPGFERLRVKYRGIFWSQSKEDSKEDPEKNPAEKLRLILNNILTLATCQLYGKGFAMKYAGQPVMDEVNSYMPYIAKAYMAKTCKDMSVNVIEIAKHLAPLIYEVCKMSAEDVMIRQLLDALIKQIIESSIEDNIFDPGGNLHESNEMTDGGEGTPKSTFPVSDLKLPGQKGSSQKEEEEKSEEKSKGSSESSKDKSEEKKSEDKPEGSDEGPGGKSEEQPEEETEEKASAGSPEKDSEESDEEQNGDGKTSDEPNGQSETADSSDSGKESEGKTKDEPDDGSEDEPEGELDDSSEDESDDESDSSETGNNSNNGQKSESSNDVSEEKSEHSREFDTEEDDSEGSFEKETAEGGMSDGTLDEVLKAMQDAAEQTREEAKDTISNINAHNAHDKRTREKSESYDKEPVVPKEMGKLIGREFEEVKRMYKVTDKLPPVLQARGRAMFRKNQRYFKSLSKPTVKNLDSGSVDPGKLYGLSFGDTEVFQKIGKDKQFDGCAYLLIDNSGSMSGNKRIESAKAGAVIEEGFRKMFPLKIVAFDSWGKVIHEVIKNWDEWLSQNCCWNYALHGREGGGNEDGYDIMIATRELLARPEKKKMLVVLSDGAPGSRSLVNKAVKDARRKGIEVYSIYFEEGRVDHRAEAVMEEMYERDYVVCPLDELDEHLNKLFKKFSRS